MAPISHHFLDSSHVSHGVVTAGLTTKEGVKIEGAVFNGREPDQKRWGIQSPRLDSFAGRVTANPHRDWSLQFSAASLNDSEQLHRGLDIMRLTASATYNLPLANGNWQTTVAWGRNKRRTPSPSDAPQPAPGDPSDGTHVHPVVPDGGAASNRTVQRGILLESAANLARRHTVFGRFESADKDELFPLDDIRHAVTYPVKRATAGYVYDLPVRTRVRIGVGVSGSLTRVPAELQSGYGENPGGVAVFMRLRFGS